jgi:hypothetical protein
MMMKNSPITGFTGAHIMNSPLK